MCGRTSLAVGPDIVRSRFDVIVPDDFHRRYNIAPREDLGAIRNDAREELDVAEWEFLPQWADDPEAVPRPINARSETVAEKPMFKDAFQHRRCLIPADGFYEWKGSRGAKQPYRIQRQDGQPYAYAGLWEPWRDPVTEETTLTCTILTTEANELVSEIHDRMPVMLEPDEEAVWLSDAGNNELQSVLDPYPSDKLEANPVSKRVNDPTNDSPALIEEVDIGTQAGLDEFGS